jgi:hypothetical protein
MYRVRGIPLECTAYLKNTAANFSINDVQFNCLQMNIKATRLRRDIHVKVNFSNQ